jgi:murein DD-endopeptidase MepM/ murein hydrolase activator NlpD
MHLARLLWREALSLPTTVLRLWHKDYQDSRIIFEQNGDLQYFALSAKVQRIAVRSALVSAITVLITLLFLTVTTIHLHISRARLEQSHQEVFKALVSSTADSESPDVGNMTEDQMVALAQSIRDRDMSIRRYVDTSMTAVSQENLSLKSQLDSSGLTEKIVRIIQQNNPKGGFNLTDDLSSNPLLRGKVADELATNRSLRDVLYALPSKMPVASYSMTSDFGIRKHPINGLTHFHTGLDLQSENGDDKVHPVKDGVVVLSQHHPQYGNTVVVRHANGIESLYAHMSQLLVKVGDKVQTDAVLGYIGNTGSSTGKHLHLEILVGGYPVNPQKVIRTAQHVQQIQSNTK